MKKLFGLLVVLTGLLFLASCEDPKLIKVSATAIPHAEVLEKARPLIEEQGFKLKVIITDDYGVPNPAVLNKSADANYFQHVPYFNLFQEEQTAANKLVNIASIHIEPIGLYSPAGAKHRASLADVQNGDTILASNSTGDLSRFLNLLHSAGLITVNNPGSQNLTKADIVANPKSLDIQTSVTPDLLIAAYTSAQANLILINGNYALAGNLNPLTDAIYLESPVNNPYVNIVACRQDNKDSDKIKALVSALTSQTIKDFITTKYGGSVIAAF